MTDPPPRASMDAGRRFAAAANAALVDAGPPAFASDFTPDADVRLNGAPSGSTAELAAVLAEIGRASPGLRFSLDPVAEGDGWLIARMALDGRGASAIDATVALRLERGRVAEVWGGPDLVSLPRALPPVLLPPWAGPTEVSLARTTLFPGAALAAQDRADVRLVLAEAGMVDVAATGPALLYGRESGGRWRGPTVPWPTVLRPGDAVLVGSGADLTVRNRGDRPASLLTLVARRAVSAPASGQGGVAVPTAAFAAGAGTVATTDVLAAGLASPESFADSPALLEVIAGKPEPIPGLPPAPGLRLAAAGDAAARTSVVVALTPARTGLPPVTASLVAPLGVSEPGRSARSSPRRRLAQR